jgi:hypothetical protein
MTFTDTADQKQVLATEIPDTIQGDRQLIREAASTIRNLWPQIDAAKTHISAGREFKPLHSRLARISRYDRSRIGWVRAFVEEDFGCTRRDAERCVRAFNTFGQAGPACPTWKMPQSLRALDLLAKLNIPLPQLAQYLQSGTIGPNTSVRAIHKLGQSLGLIEPKPAVKKSAKSERAAIPTLVWAWAHTSLEARREFLDGLGSDALRGVMSAKLCAELRDRFERQRARASADKAGKAADQAATQPRFH